MNIHQIVPRSDCTSFAKYRKYADEWLNNLTDAQIEGFEKQRIGQIDKSKCV